MKKTVALILCIVTAFTCVIAYAEDTEKTNIGMISINGIFDLKGVLPEGYSVKIRKMDNDEVLAWIISEDPAKPRMQLSIAYDETYADVDRLNDLEESGFEALEKTFIEEDPTVEISYGDTGLGTRLLIAKQVNDIYSYVDFFSIYKGYMIEFVLLPAQNSGVESLTEEQISMCIDFLTELDFDPVAEETEEAAEPEEEIPEENI